jgi:hypothetical protein
MMLLARFGDERQSRARLPSFSFLLGWDPPRTDGIPSEPSLMHPAADLARARERARPADVQSDLRGSQRLGYVDR